LPQIDSANNESWSKTAIEDNFLYNGYDCPKLKLEKHIKEILKKIYLIEDETISKTVYQL